MKTSKQKKSRNIGNISRRDFVGKVGKAAVAFTIIPGNLQGEESSKRLVLGTSRRSSIADNLTSARISPFRGFYIMFFLAIWICLSSSLCIKIQAQGKTTNLKELWDSVKVCKNPDKGWYEHYNPGRRTPANDAVLDSFPGMDHLYIRLSWAHFEPQEGQFDWHWIDDVVNQWVPK